MKVALYARVSTVDKNQNPEVQLAELREYCRRQDWEISEEYIDLASASDFVHRKAWARSMEDAAKRKYKALVVWKMDRAFRDIEMAWRTVKILRGYGIDMVFMTQPELNVAGPAGDLIFTIYAGFAQFERDIIRERSMAGMLHAKKCGTKSGNPIGKPRIDIDITKVCKAYQLGGRKFSAAAEIISKWVGKKVTPGFVQIRLQRECQAQGLTIPQLVDIEMEKEEVTA
ncbi:recombinase family protein [Dehalococcoides mccartyi]|uniref:Recombinase family protein n=1 Tax=Dehalococcoides mccartyi TaxID=61435 RepID=A0AB38ZA33_9CHLR|nr:recombinase family protein [Dehalococcoides mccartyi]WRO07401.1 recombinase family protein [Dehalococcoides mccartyi]BAS31187.1 hypothetical protein IBK_0112 [Dehalococcoides mccartyi IBARAKI]